MEIDKVHIRYCMLFQFNSGKTAAKAQILIRSAYGENTVTANTCREWFSKFRSSNFDVSHKPHSGRSQELKSNDLRVLMLDQHDSISSIQLAKQLQVDQTTVIGRLHAMRRIQKEGK